LGPGLWFGYHPEAAGPSHLVQVTVIQLEVLLFYYPGPQLFFEYTTRITYTTTSPPTSPRSPPERPLSASSFSMPPTWMPVTPHLQKLFVQASPSPSPIPASWIWVSWRGETHYAGQSVIFWARNWRSKQRQMRNGARICVLISDFSFPFFLSFA
jgi:hypothetical protein